MEQAICPRCLGGGEVPPPDGSQDGVRCPECSGTGGVDPLTLGLYDCQCPPCPGRGNDGHGLSHCAECCFGSGVEADPDCPTHGERRKRDERQARLYAVGMQAVYDEYRQEMDDNYWSGS